MKRDWNLWRLLLAHVEAETLARYLSEMTEYRQFAEGQFFPEHVKGETEKLKRIVFEHLKLLIEAGLIAGVTVDYGIDGKYSYGLHNPRLTNAGHDFLQAMRSDTLWNKVKSAAKEKGLELSISTVKALIPYALKAVLS